MEIDINTKLTDYRKIDAKRKKALKKLGLNTIKDLVFYYPKRHEDFSTVTPLNKIKVGEINTIRGKIKSIDNEITARRRMRLTKAIISDETGSIQAVWFHQMYLKNYLVPGTYVTLVGKIETAYPQGLQIVTPSYEKFKNDSVHSGRIVPIYSESAYLTSRWL